MSFNCNTFEKDVDKEIAEKGSKSSLGSRGSSPNFRSRNNSEPYCPTDNDNIGAVKSIIGFEDRHRPRHRSEIPPWKVDLHSTPSRVRCGKQSLTTRHSRAGTPMYRTSQAQYVKPQTDSNKSATMGNIETLQNKASKLSIKHMSSSHSVPECVMHNAVLNISQTKEKSKCSINRDNKKSKKQSNAVVPVTSGSKNEPEKKNWDEWIEPDLNLRQMLDKLEQDECSVKLDDDFISTVAGSSETIKFTALSDALLPKKPCTFIVMGSNPGEPKKNFKEDHLQPLLSKMVSQNKYDTKSSEGKLHQIGIGGILKWHIFDTSKNYMEQIIKDGGDSCLTLEETEEPSDDVVPYYQQYKQYKKKGIKKVNFHTEVDVISFAGGEGGNVISRKFEPLKNEKMQQARNSELRKGYSVLRIQRVEAWPKHLKRSK